MAKKHMRIYAECDDLATAQSFGTWLNTELDTELLDPNNDLENDGKVCIYQKVEGIDGTVENRVILFMNITDDFNRTGLMEVIKTRIQESDIVSKLLYIKIEKWICTHDEKFPTPCIPEIMFEERYE